jgi:hypothetical protein
MVPKAVSYQRQSEKQPSLAQALDRIDMRAVGWNSDDVKIVGQATQVEIEQLLWEAEGRPFRRRLKLVKVLRIGHPDRIKSHS